MENEVAMNEMQMMTWSPKEVMQQVTMIQELMAAGMKVDEHYGVIPGTNSKPTLFKAGAEKLCLMFRLAPRFEIIDKDLGNGHREIQVKCTLTHINTGKFWGEGVGSCSTMESKYRYRSGVGESTKVQVPKGFWDLRRAGKTEEAMAAIGGKGYTFKKGEDGLWWIHEKADKQENPDIADTYNTVLKIAKKRAVVDATITATAASDIFTQDLEEIMPEKFEQKAEVKAEPPKTVQKPLISHEEQLEIVRLIKVKNIDVVTFKAFLKNTLGADGTARIAKEDYPAVYEWIVKNEREVNK